MSTSSKQSKEQAKTFLEKLLSILEDIIEQAKLSNQQSNSNVYRELVDVQSNLSKVKSCFTTDSGPILDEVEAQLETYRARIQTLLADKPQASVPSSLESVKNQLKNSP